MDRHILFFDIDGTLIHVPSGHKKPSEYLKNAIHKLQENGHLCFIATGRTYAYLNKDILDLNFDGYITCNGAVVLKDDQLLITHFFEKDMVKEITTFLEKKDNPYTLCSARKAYTPKRFNEVYEVFREFGVPEKNVCSNMDLDLIDVAKFEVTAKNNEVASYIRNLKEKGLEVVEYGESNVFEFTMGNITKGNSVKEVLRTLNIPIENSIAFGDGDNDIEMLQVVGRGVAMGNGSDAVKKVATTITEACNDEGIVKELQRLGLINNII